MKIKDYFAKAIKWNRSSDAEHPWCTTLEGKKARVRLNDFPAQSLYTLIVDGSETDFDAWPSAWKRATTKTTEKVSQTNGTRRRPIKAIA
jgi:hypothetical protein